VPRPPADFAARADGFTGTYRPTRLGSTTLIKVAALLQSVDVSATADGSLVIGANRWVEVEPLLFQRADGQARLAFRADAQGRISHLFLGAAAFEKVAWFDVPAVHLGMLGLAGLLFLSALLTWLIDGLVGRRRGRRASGPRLARWLAGGTSALFLTFMVGLAIVLSDALQLASGLPPLLIGVLVIGLLAAAATVGVVACAGLAWMKRWWGLVGRVQYTLVALATLAVVGELQYWNLLGIRF
jgi:hypothetical protein